ncbi:transposase [Streptomyces sp. CLV115]|uniref:transposase n=1 Tax=Streptomyces sp. CLV115 TaxID=3138502 RepID=UPI00406C065B
MAPTTIRRTGPGRSDDRRRALAVGPGTGQEERGDPSNAEWERLRPFLPVSNRRCVRWRDHRQMTDGILHQVRTGVQWRDLAERFGPWRTVSFTWAPTGLSDNARCALGRWPRPAPGCLRR